MIFKELELFKGVGFEFVKEISDVCSEKSYAQNAILFNLGDRANRLFFLDQGMVNLVINNGGGINFGISQPGEMFGWSAMVDNGTYTSTGVAITDLNVFEIEREKLNLVFNRHPKDGLKVMKILAGIITKRLVRTYHELLAARG
jgi:CRP-like cAMP-binding protein